MQYAIELYYDQETEDSLYALAKKVADEKISTRFLEWKTRPHLTLACYNDVNEDKCTRKLKDFAKTHPAMPAYIGSIGMFNDTGTIFVSPIMNSMMYQFQRELYEMLGCFDAKGWEWYCPDRWVPHCTVALTGEDGEDAFFRASDLMLHEFKKLSGAFVSIGLVKITCPVEEIVAVELGAS
ncbi:MAG: 2'-5' RNA ligase family protein [Ruminococcus flavefaciens]|nr:2'-5' RNA ligase family protein [Ruminococcus flavefaciens]